MQTSPGDSRAIIITEIEQFGGAERSVLALSRWLYQRHRRNHIVTYFDRCNFAQYATHPLQVIELKPSSGARNKIAALRTYFNQHPPNSPKPLASGYQPALHATLAGQRAFHTLMHDTPSLFGDQDNRSLSTKLRIAISNRIIGYGLRTGGNTIVTSEYLRSECHKDFNIDAKIARMGGLSTQTQSPPSHPVNDQLRMFSVCRIEPNKRIDWIIRALAELERADQPLSTIIDWRLDLAGMGSLLPALRNMAQTLGIGDRIHFHGFVPDDDLERLFAQTHLFLMPAVQGYGIPAIESLHRGIPVLLHRESGVSDILLDTPWATVFSGGEENMTPALRSAIDGILQGKHHAVMQPHLPSEDEWAERVAKLCNWL
ncbi:glycosyltransferase family 4 protein [Tunturiibacter gelidiferens]|uniref:glycosyltransferase family 4 protein n=1 Tax=Tunturiibacter gelidiferens TaxID=3069689 RepID=UPI003D9B3997